MDFNKAADQAPALSSSRRVPAHILDMIPLTARAYIESSKDRLLAGIPEEQHAGILAQSTHHIAGSALRRALHEQILLALTSHLPDTLPEKSTLLYVAGPMAAGKSTLLSRFDSRIAEEQAGKETLPFDNKGLQSLYETYKSIRSRRVASDFGFYKA